MVIMATPPGFRPLQYKAAIEAGELPNLQRLMKQGASGKLRSTLPPISSSSWSSFLTGVNPGKHNIFDFLSIDHRNYLPRLSSVEIGGVNRTLKVGKYRIPLGKPSIRPMRKKTPFWKYLGDHDIFSDVIRVPITWPEGGRFRLTTPFS